MKHFRGRRSSARRVGVLAAVMLAGGPALIALTPPAAHAAGWSQRTPNGDTGLVGSPPFDVVVDRGRVWWLTRHPVTREADSTIIASTYALRSRSLAGGSVRTVQLDLSGVTPAGPEFPNLYVSNFSMRDGTLTFGGNWIGPNDPGDGRGFDAAPGNVIATFDATSGAPLSQRRSDPATTLSLASGYPAVLVADRTGGAATFEIPSTGQPLATTPPTKSPATTVAGNFALTYDTNAKGDASTWGSGAGNAIVTDLRTGKVTYKLRADQLRRASQAPSKAAPNLVLQDDGSIAVTIAQRKATPAGLRPIVVTASGHIRPTGARIPYVKSITATTRFNRTLLQFDRESGNGRRATLCSGYWISSNSGNSARRLLVNDDLGLPRDQVAHWDRRYLVFTTQRSDPRATGIRVDKSVQRLRLKPGANPSCDLRAP